MCAWVGVFVGGGSGWEIDTCTTQQYKSGQISQNIFTTKILYMKITFSNYFTVKIKMQSKGGGGGGG